VTNVRVQNTGDELLPEEIEITTGDRIRKQGGRAKALPEEEFQ